MATTKSIKPKSLTTAPVNEGAPEQKDMKGFMMQNDRKTTGKHPDYNGKVCVEGVMYWISAWVNVSLKTKKEFISISLTAIDSQEETEA